MENTNNTSNKEEIININNYQGGNIDSSIESKKLLDKIEPPKEITVKSLTNLADLIPKEEKAVAVKDSSEYFSARQAGYFSNAAGMVQLEDVLDGCIYAAIRVNDKGTRFIQYCQKYDEGIYSPRMNIAQSDLIFAAQNNFSINNITLPALKSKLNRFIISVADDYLGKFNGKNVLNIQEILMVLFRVLNKLPVDTEKAEATAEQFYIQVVNTIKDRYRDKKLFDWVYHKGYYALTDVDLMYVAEDMDISTKDLLKKLKEFNFLYRTDSSMGYQTKIRFDSEHEGWAYCVARLELKEQVESTEEKSEQSGISE